MDFPKDVVIHKLRAIRKAKVVILIDEQSKEYGMMEVKSIKTKWGAVSYHYAITIGGSVYDLMERINPLSFVSNSIKVTKGAECLFDSAWNFDEETKLVYPIRGDFKFRIQSYIFSPELKTDLLVKVSPSFKLIKVPAQLNSKLLSWLDSKNNLVLKSSEATLETTLDLSKELMIAFVFFTYTLYPRPKIEVFNVVLGILLLSFLCVGIFVMLL